MQVVDKPLLLSTEQSSGCVPLRACEQRPLRRSLCAPPDVCGQSWPAPLGGPAHAYPSAIAGKVKARALLPLISAFCAINTDNYARLVLPVYGVKTLKCLLCSAPLQLLLGPSIMQRLLPQDGCAVQLDGLTHSLMGKNTNFE